MGRRTNRQTDMRARIAAAAARLMAEDGIDDFALAKRKAARQLGASDTESLPRNDEIEALWGIVDPILTAWRQDTSSPLPQYPAGSSGPSEADALLDEGRQWRRL